MLRVFVGCKRRVTTRMRSVAKNSSSVELLRLSANRCLRRVESERHFIYVTQSTSGRSNSDILSVGYSLFLGNVLKSCSSLCECVVDFG